MEEYYDNGQLAMIGLSYYGVRQGEFCYYDTTGSISKIMRYKVFKDLNPMNEHTRVVDIHIDSLTGEFVEIGHTYPSQEKLEFVEFYNPNGFLDSIQHWSGDTLRHTSRQKK
jgi:antitoxin component YwqK of YwqJK toxin-antitoxin module